MCFKASEQGPTKEKKSEKKKQSRIKGMKIAAGGLHFKNDFNLGHPRSGGPVLLPSCY